MDIESIRAVLVAHRPIDSDRNRTSQCSCGHKMNWNKRESEWQTHLSTVLLESYAASQREMRKWLENVIREMNAVVNDSGWSARWAVRLSAILEGKGVRP